MGIRQDYLKKQIDQMARVLAKLLGDIIGLKNDMRISEAEEIVNTVSEKDLGFNFDEVIQKENEELLNYLLNEKQFSTETIEAIANILYELGEIMGDKNKQLNYFKKAILLFEHLNKERKTFSFDFMLKINKMKEINS